MNEDDLIVKLACNKIKNNLTRIREINKKLIIRKLIKTTGENKKRYE